MTPVGPVSDLLLRSQTDERLCALARDGHERAFTTFVGRHAGLIAAIAAAVGGRPGVEDVTQESLARAWRALTSGATVTSPRAWLVTIVRNTALEMQRPDGAVGVDVDTELADPQWQEEGLQQRLEARELLRALATLPLNQRRVLVGAELQGVSRSDLARELGVSEGAVRQLTHRARGSLRAVMTALVPYPLISWAAGHGAPAATGAGGAAVGGAGAGSAITGSAGAGGAALGGVALKGGIALLAVGAIGGGIVLHDHRAGPSDRARRAASSLSAGAGSGSTTTLPQLVSGLETATSASSRPNAGQHARHQLANPAVRRGRRTVTPVSTVVAHPILSRSEEGVSPAPAASGEAASAGGDGEAPRTPPAQPGPTTSSSSESASGASESPTRTSSGAEAPVEQSAPGGEVSTSTTASETSTSPSGGEGQGVPSVG